jgi:chromosome segregation protein
VKLTTLEIKGFKSFADKTTIHFNQNITGVVGPNGCGKSNIVDAIRWVLGETKSSNLRTERMENLVFNGTKARKSSGLAEVSLTFENTRNLLPTEYHTVTISRHYYRTGESEYRLNNVPCRLKDIRSLFLDTGISSDSYAIIELNMLSDLLTDKENSRRRLFEQAAGISKYKIRRHETLLKLKSTQTDLDRVEDLLFEIGNNLQELEKQANKTRKFQSIKDKYRELSVEWAIALVGDQKETYQRITEQKTREEDRRLQLETEMAGLQADLEQFKTTALDQEKELATLQGHYNAELEALNKKENERNLLRERGRYLVERRDNLAREIREAEENARRFEQESAQLEKNRRIAQESMEHIQAQLEQLNADLTRVRRIHSEARQRLEDKQQAFRSLDSAIVEAQKRLEINEVRKDNFRRELERMAEEQARRSSALGTLEQQEAEWLSRQADAAARVEALEHAEESLTQSLESNRIALEKAAQELAVFRRELDAKRHEYRLTKNMVDSLEGYPEAIRYLRKHVEVTKKAPLLSDLVNCAEEWKPAVEGFLEPWLNHYVLPDLASALSAVDQLSAKQQGRAAFLILSQVKGERESMPSLPDHMIPALDVVETDPAFRPLLQALLGKAVILTSGLQEGDADWLRANGLSGIAQSGLLVHSGFQLSGGSVGLFKGKRLGRVLNLEKLEKEIAALELKESQCRTESDRLKGLDAELRQTSSREELKTRRRELEAASASLLACRARMEEIGGSGASDEARKADVARQIEVLESENEQLAASLSSQREVWTKLSDEVAKLDEEFQALNNQLGLATSNYNQQNIRFHQQQNQLNTLSQELSFKIQKLEETANHKTRNEQGMKAAVEENTRIEAQLVGLEEYLQQAYQKRDEAGSAIRQAEETYYASRAAISECEESLRQLNRNRDQTLHLLESIKDRVNELKLQLNSVRERLMIEFQIDLESLLDREPSEGLSAAELGEKVDRIKRKLENYGEINPMAVQAFEEMKTRHDFIQVQRQDLLDAKQSLMDTISEIDETARVQFMEAFHQVRENFIGVFRKLFREEDDCDLVLQDPENPLETRIDIVAKPKGKRPQVIDQLSGGEKTLTAMALLFGLYLLKPAPFCVLDEVDAPLDDANINKYNDMIRTFSDQSQFILVTHNKRTMARVDTIYGVTMQEQGISKVVPVTFQAMA